MGCPLWVKSRHVQRKRSCPLYLRKRTFEGALTLNGPRLHQAKVLCARITKAGSARRGDAQAYSNKSFADKFAPADGPGAADNRRGGRRLCVGKLRNQALEVAKDVEKPATFSAYSASVISREAHGP